MTTAGTHTDIDWLRDFNQRHHPDNIAVNTLVPWSRMEGSLDGLRFDVQKGFVLKRKLTNVLADNPVRSTELTEMTFDWDRLEVPPPDPTKLKGITVTNWSNTKQVAKRSVVHKVTRTSKTTHKFHGFLKVSAGVEIKAKAGSKGFDAGVGAHLKIERSLDMNKIKTNAETDTTTVTVHTLPKHRMSLVIQGNRYTARVPWKGIIQKTYWDGRTEQVSTEGFMEQISISDFEVNYGRMTRVDESIFEKPKTPGMNMAAFMGAEFEGDADLVWKLSDQHDKVWSFDFGGRKVVKHPLGETLAFWRPTNYDNEFYALGDKFVKDHFETNIVENKEGWPCEHADAVASGLDSTAALYKSQDGQFSCGQHKILIEEAYYGTPLEKRICKTESSWKLKWWQLIIPGYNIHAATKCMKTCDWFCPKARFNL